MGAYLLNYRGCSRLIASTIQQNDDDVQMCVEVAVESFRVSKYWIVVHDEEESVLKSRYLRNTTTLTILPLVRSHIPFWAPGWLAGWLVRIPSCIDTGFVAFIGNWMMVDCRVICE